MTPVEYPVTPIKQKSAECLQTAATQLISFFDPSITVAEVLAAVPVYVENGTKIGTSPGHLAAYLAGKGYKTTAYIFDVELFDRSWDGLSPQEVLRGLQAREPHIPANSWLAAYHHVLIDGWKRYVEAGGQFAFPALSSQLLRSLLDTAPFFLSVNSTYFNQKAKSRYNKETDKFDFDAISGRSLTHAMTCAGYKDGEFLIIDPDPLEGVDAKRWVASDHLISSIMAAQTESDNFLISIAK